MEFNTDYRLLCEQMAGLLDTEKWYVSAMSNAAALLWQQIPQINWAGFYIMHHGRLNVGPFEGQPACIHISPGKGVCGTAVAEDREIVVPDVHQFPGHITCDPVSCAEIVIPIHQKSNGKVKAVLDIDSPVKNRFTDEDREGLLEFAKLLSGQLTWE